MDRALRGQRRMMRHGSCEQCLGDGGPRVSGSWRLTPGFFRSSFGERSAWSDCVLRDGACSPGARGGRER